MIDFECLIDGPFELYGVALHFRRNDRVLDLAERAEQSAAIDAQPVLRAHQSEFHSEPEEARQGSDDASQPVHLLGFIPNPGHQFRGCVRTLAEAHQRFRKRTVRVHGDVARDIVEDVGFGQIVELLRGTNGDGGGEETVAKTIEEHERRNIAAHGLRLKARQWLQKSIYVRQPWNALRIEAKRVNPLEEMFVREAIPARRHARK